MKNSERIKILENALLLVKEHLIMNGMNTPRVHEKIEEALYGYYCKGCKKMLMPTNKIEALENNLGFVYVHDDDCDAKEYT